MHCFGVARRPWQRQQFFSQKTKGFSHKLMHDNPSIVIIVYRQLRERNRTAAATRTWRKISEPWIKFGGYESCLKWVEYEGRSSRKRERRVELATARLTALLLAADTFFAAAVRYFPDTKRANFAKTLCRNSSSNNKRVITLLQPPSHSSLEL